MNYCTILTWLNGLSRMGAISWQTTRPGSAAWCLGGVPRVRLSHSRETEFAMFIEPVEKPLQYLVWLCECFERQHRSFKYDDWGVANIKFAGVVEMKSEFVAIILGREQFHKYAPGATKHCLRRWDYLEEVQEDLGWTEGRCYTDDIVGAESGWKIARFLFHLMLAKKSFWVVRGNGCKVFLALHSMISFVPVFYVNSKCSVWRCWFADSPGCPRPTNLKNGVHLAWNDPCVCSSC